MLIRKCFISHSISNFHFGHAVNFLGVSGSFKILLVNNIVDKRRHLDRTCFDQVRLDAFLLPNVLDKCPASRSLNYKI